MPISTTITGFMTNPEINPTFAKDCIVILTKDYAELDPLGNKDLKKDEVGVIIACGHSLYRYDIQTNNFSILVNSEEWCRVDVGPTAANSDESEGWVKAEDLRELSDEDLELD